MRAGARSACLGACRHRGFAPRLGCVERCAVSFTILVLRLRISTLNRGERTQPCAPARSPGLRPGVCAVFSPSGAGPLCRSASAGTGARRARAVHTPCTSPPCTHVHAPARAQEHPAGRAPPRPPLRAAAPGGAPCCEPNKPCCETVPRGDTPFPGARTRAPAAQMAIWAEPGRPGSHTARLLPVARHPVVVLHPATPIRYTLVITRR